MVGEGSGIVPDRGLNILNRVTLNTLMNLTAADLTLDNVNISTQSQANTRLSTDTPKGLLAGAIVKAGTTSQTVVICDNTSSEQPLGVIINNAAGYPFESSSGVASGKAPYLHGAGSVFTTDLYETFQTDGTTVLTYTPGLPLYASANGLLSNVTGVSNTTIVVGIVLIAPSASDPFMAVQMRI